MPGMPGIPLAPGMPAPGEPAWGVPAPGLPGACDPPGEVEPPEGCELPGLCPPDCPVEPVLPWLPEGGLDPGEPLAGGMLLGEDGDCDGDCWLVAQPASVITSTMAGSRRFWKGHRKRLAAGRPVRRAADERTGVAQVAGWVRYG